MAKTINNKQVPEVKAKDIRYFSSIRNYTLALLNAFDNVKLYIEQNKDTQKEYIVPITFGNYEKSVVLEDITEKELQKGNYNFVPRLVLSFEGMTKNIERQTNKFQKLSKRITHPDAPDELMVSYNSLSYDFNFTLLLQTRGLTQASQVTEQILSYFKPGMNLMIQEFPIFENKTETQIVISDPAFEINQEQDEPDTNIISVTFDILVKGNIYSPIEMQAPVSTIKLFTHIWDLADYEQSKLAGYYKFEKKPNSEHLKIIERNFDATIPYDKVVEQDEQEVIQKRPDYRPPERIIETKD